GVEASGLELVVAVADGGQGGGLLVAQQAGVDALGEAHLEIPRPQLLDPLPPAGLAEEVVVEQEHLAGPGLAPPDVPDRLLRADGPLLAGHDAERAAQPAAALGEAQRVPVAGVDG